MAEGTDSPSSSSPYPTPPLPRKVVFVLGVIHVTIFFYALCFGLQQPILPYLIEELGADVVQFGYLQTWFSLLQLIGSPLLGIFGDRFGSKAALLISILSSALSYLLVGLSDNLLLLFLSRLPTLFQHGILACQAYITDITDEASRAKQMGRLMFTWGIGFICGPSLGGTLSKHFSLRTPAFVAAFLSFLSVISIWLLMENPPKRKAPKSKSSSPDLSSSSSSASSASYPPTPPATSFKVLLTRPNVFPLLSIRLLGGFASALFQSVLTVVLKERFHMDAQQNGMMMSLFGSLMAITQGVIIGLITPRYSDEKIIRYCLFLLLICFMVLIGASQLYQFILLFVPMVSSGVILSTILSSYLTKSVTSAETGSILGIDMGCSSATRVASPTLGMYFLRTFGYPSIPFLSSTLIISILLFSLPKLKPIPKIA